MQSKICNVINACTLVGLGTVFLSFYWTGRIEQYLNPLFRPFVLVGGILTFIMGLICLLALPSEHCCDMDEDSRLSSGFASNAGFPADSKNGIVRDLNLSKNRADFMLSLKAYQRGSPMDGPWEWATDSGPPTRRC
jgi:hypothetical protein